MEHGKEVCWLYTAFFDAILSVREGMILWNRSVKNECTICKAKEFGVDDYLNTGGVS